ncbi:MAG: threonylcarbamoyl-AMP synthase [Phycisphaeraceae bacterium]|nr:threonylcarbamoyl-AMP synthase [Phycisphaeraceae bacterium]
MNVPSSTLSSLIIRAKEIILAGGVVGLPTETVYGLAANALDPIAVAMIFEIKNRPKFDPLIVHVPDTSSLEELVIEISQTTQRLAGTFWPGPLTLVLPKNKIVPDIVTAGLPNVAIRVPDHPIAQQLLRSVRVPLAAPSANRFGSVSPTTAEHVRQELGNAVPLVLEGGSCRAGVESTVLSLVEEPTLLRPGAVAIEDIEAVIGSVRRLDKTDKRILSPGMSALHYAPRTRLYFGGSRPVGRVGLLSLGPPSNTSGYTAVEVLSPSGNTIEAATNLFAAIRRLDAMELDAIYAEPVPDQGLGLAINDRLRRASAIR